MAEAFLSRFTRKRSKSSFRRRDIPFESQCRLTIHYEGEPLRKQYIADLMCFGEIIAELKACDRLTGTDEAQILNYMKATRKGVGVLLNFGSPIRLEWKRYVI